MEEAYKQREVAIKKCISVASEDVNKLRTLKMNNPDDGDILKKLRKNQTKVCQYVMLLILSALKGKC